MATLPSPWIAGFGYAAHVLGNPNPWAAPSAMGSFARDAARLLWLRALDLDLSPLVELWVADKGVQSPEAMADLFDDPWWRERLEPGLGAVAASIADLPIALSLPNLGALADRLAGPGSGADDFVRDDLAIGLSCLLRLTAPLGVSWLLLRDLGTDWAEIIAPIVNVSDHLLVSLAAVSPEADGESFPGFAHVFTGSAVVVPSYWLDPAVDAPTFDGALYTELPTAANPERVREVLSRPPWSICV